MEADLDRMAGIAVTEAVAAAGWAVSLGNWGPDWGMGGEGAAAIVMSSNQCRHDGRCVPMKFHCWASV